MDTNPRNIRLITAEPTQPSPARAWRGDELLPPTKLRFHTTPSSAHKPVILGRGAYATLYEIDELVLPKSLHAEQGNKCGIERSLAAKVFHDNFDTKATRDWEVVLWNELEAYHALGHHKNIAALRGTIERMAPTFVCAACGRTIQITHCPTCQALLRPDFEPILRCTAGHRFDRDQIPLLTATRECGHRDADAHCINLYFRPYLFLEHLPMDAVECNAALRPERSQPSAKAAAEFGLTSTDVDSRKREVMLHRLAVALGCAEGLAHCHAQNFIFVDLTARNVLIDSGGKNSTSIVGVKLVDPGRARNKAEHRTSVTPIGDAHFLAPEQSSNARHIDRVKIHFKNERPAVNDLCLLVLESNVDLEPSDILLEQVPSTTTGNQAQYLVLAEAEAANNPDYALLAAAAGKSCAHFARILEPPANKPSASGTTLVLHEALGFPSDVYSLGCFIAWFVAHGEEEFVKRCRSYAHTATVERTVLDKESLGKILRTSRTTLERMIDLPDTPADNVLRSELLHLIFRCLVRADGAYCKNRSHNDPAATLMIVRDIQRLARDLLVLFRSHSNTRLIALDSEQGQAQVVAELQAKNDELQNLNTDLRAKRSNLENLLTQTRTDATQRSRRGHTWHIATTLATAIALPILVATQCKPTTSVRNQTNSDASDTPTGELLKVPNISNQGLVSAIERAKRAGIKKIYVTGGTGDFVATQDPAEGAQIKNGEPIKITLKAP